MNREQLLDALIDIDCQLSPENLSCDGELSHAQTAKRAADLMAERRKVIAALGDEPRQSELYGI